MSITDIETYNNPTVSEVNILENSSIRSLTHVQWKVNKKIHILYPHENTSIDAEFSKIGIIGYTLQFRRNTNWFTI